MSLQSIQFEIRFKMKSIIFLAVLFVAAKAQTKATESTEASTLR